MEQLRKENWFLTQAHGMGLAARDTVHLLAPTFGKRFKLPLQQQQ